MSATFPLVVVLIACKVISGGPEDMNAGMTGSRNLDWDMTNGMLHCRRIEAQVTSAAEMQGQEAPPWTPEKCPMAAISIATQWDAQHSNSNYRIRWAACPTPIHTDKDPSSPIVGWKLPECPYKDGTVDCEQDSVI